MLIESDIDVLVIEDLDRFEDIEIFIQLKELNFLVNSKLRAEKKNRIIKFIYMVKDDIFKTKERTKFFDFIIPVVPVTTSYNSYNQLIKLLGDSEKYEYYLDEDYLYEISLFIDDNRLLYNICNEYILYYYNINLKIRKLDKEKLFSILVYKNFCPSDFIMLCKNKGNLCEIISKKENLILELTTNYEKQIEKLKERRKKILN